jgi:hypothetical protein
MRAATRKAPGSSARHSDPADPQKEAVYAWEDEWRAWNLDTLTLAECRITVRAACRRYGLPPPPVSQHKGVSEYDCLTNRITLQSRNYRGRGGKNPAQVLHEVAHYVVFRRHGWRPADHGPTFVGVYLDLLEAAEIAPRSALHASARAFGIKWREATP